MRRWRRLLRVLKAGKVLAAWTVWKVEIIQRDQMVQRGLKP